MIYLRQLFSEMRKVVIRMITLVETKHNFEGDDFITEWYVLLMMYCIVPLLFFLILWSWHNFTNELLIKVKPFRPFDHGNATAIFLLWVFINFSNSRDVKAVPLSDTIFFGLPKEAKIFTKWLITSCVDVVLTGHNQVNLVNVSITKKMWNFRYVGE